MEGPSKRNPTVTTGRTTQTSWSISNRWVDAGRRGSFADVEVTAAARHHLAGALIGVTSWAFVPGAHPRLRWLRPGWVVEATSVADGRLDRRWWPWSVPPPRESPKSLTGLG